MKNKSQLLFILLMIMVSLPSICFSEQPNPKIWEPLGYNLFYNKKIITKASGVLLVWTYKAVTDDARAKRIEEVKKYDLEKSVKYQNYHHEADLWEIDCKNRLIKMEEFIDFDKNGMVLDRYRYNNSELESIIPNSGGERLYQNVCMTRKKPPKKKK
jgi:hypothetical protein